MRTSFLLLLVVAFTFVSSCNKSTDPSIDGKTAIVGSWTITPTTGSEYTADISITDNILKMNSLSYKVSFNGAQVIGNDTFELGGVTVNAILTFNLKSETSFDGNKKTVAIGSGATVYTETFTGTKNK